MLANARKLLNAYEAAHGPIAVAATVRMNHDGCKAGSDTKSRLYLTRTGPSVVLAYCHNCAQGAALNGGPGPGAYRGPAVVPTGTIQDVELPPTYIPGDGMVGLTTAARDWLFAAGMTPTDCTNLEFAWDYPSNRLLMPVYARYVRDSWDGELRGYQLRGFDPARPKYLTVTGGAPLETVFLGSSLMVITEDLISAYRVRDASGASAVPVFRSRTSAEHLARSARAVRDTAGTLGIAHVRALVWLDNDNPGVVDHARYLERILNTMGMRTERVVGAGDPKKLTDEQIATIIESCAPTP